MGRADVPRPGRTGRSRPAEKPPGFSPSGVSLGRRRGVLGRPLGPRGCLGITGHLPPVDEPDPEADGHQDDHQPRDQAEGPPLDGAVGGPARARPPRIDEDDDERAGDRGDASAGRAGRTGSGERLRTAHRPLAAARAIRRSAHGSARALRVASTSARIASPAVAAGDVLRRGVGPPLDLDRPLLQPALADDDPQRDPDQVGVLELHARALVAVVDQHVDARPPRAASRAPSVASITAAFWTWSGTSSDLVRGQRPAAR